MTKTMTQVLRETTLDYLDSLDKKSPPSPDEITAELIERTAEAYEGMNAALPKGRKWPIPNQLSTSQIADIIAALYPVARVSCLDKAADSDYDLLAVYQTDGPDEGTYATSESLFREIARQYNYNIKSRDLQEILLILQDKAPRVGRCSDRNLVAVNNGVFDYETKDLLPFSPDMVFLTKSRVDYVPGAANPTIHNTDDNTDWDVESWIQELSDDPEIVNLLWEILGAVIRPCVRWNKSAWFYSDTGNNGKGTLCELMRQLCGDGNHTSISLADFSKDFALEPLTHTSAIIVDENDVGTYIDKAANLKAVITNDTIQINRKFKQPIAYQFRGFMVQCLNELPQVKDKSDSFYRRQLFVPFRKCFTGSERKYIKDDYLHRKEVLEYVLCRVLNMNYYTLSEPAACKNALNEYKEFNDPVRQFFTEVEDLLVWDLVPFTFLYDLYKKWLAENAPSVGSVGKSGFIGHIASVLYDSSEWIMPGKDSAGKYVKTRTGSKMNAPEPLILRYDLKNWMKRGYTGNNPNIQCTTDPQQSYRGILRASAAASAAPDTNG